MTVDRDKIRSKLDFLRGAIGLLEKIRSRGEQEILSDPVLESAAVRNLQVGIEAMLDMANHIIARERLGVPRTYRQAIEILLEHGILPASRGEAFFRLVGFRNRAVHLYDRLEPREVAAILSSCLDDFEEFSGAVVRRYFSGDS